MCEASDTPGVEGVPELTLESFCSTRPSPARVKRITSKSYRPDGEGGLRSRAESAGCGFFIVPLLAQRNLRTGGVAP
jgi:hypothetical protein